MEYFGGIDGLICSHFNFIFGFIVRCNSFFHTATVVILASSACLGTVESLFSAATSETTIACGTATVYHFHECFEYRLLSNMTGIRLLSLQFHLHSVTSIPSAMPIHYITWKKAPKRVNLVAEVVGGSLSSVAMFPSFALNIAIMTL